MKRTHPPTIKQEVGNEPLAKRIKKEGAGCAWGGDLYQNPALKGELLCSENQTKKNNQTV